VVEVVCVVWVDEVETESDDDAIELVLGSLEVRLQHRA